MLTEEQRKESARNASRRYKAKNKEKCRANLAKWMAANKEKRKAYKAAYNESNRERLHAYGKEYHRKNREKRAAYALTYIAKNKEDMAAYRAQWAKDNPEKCRQYQHERRALEKNAATGDPAPILAWERAWRSKKRVTCYWCRESFSPKKCHSDHVVALKLDGAHAVENLCIACFSCNSRKNARTLDAWNERIAEPVLL